MTEEQILTPEQVAEYLMVPLETVMGRKSIFWKNFKRCMRWQFRAGKGIRLS